MNPASFAFRIGVYGLLILFPSANERNCVNYSNSDFFLNGLSKTIGI